MFQGDINYPYEKASERIEQIMNADEKNVTWMPYVARHKAIYEYNNGTLVTDYIDSELVFSKK